MGCPWALFSGIGEMNFPVKRTIEGSSRKKKDTPGYRSVFLILQQGLLSAALSFPDLGINGKIFDAQAEGQQGVTDDANRNRNFTPGGQV